MASRMLADPSVRFIAGGWTMFIAENLVLSHNRQGLIDFFERGEETYHLVYNTLSTTCCCSIAYGYLRHRTAVMKRGSKASASASASVLRFANLGRHASNPAVRLGSFACTSLGLIGFSQLAPKVQIPVYIPGLEKPSVGPQPQPQPQPQRQPTRREEPKEQKSGLIQVRCPIDFKAKDRPEGALAYGVERVSRHATFWSLGLFGLGSAIITPFPAEAVFFGFTFLFAAIGTTHQDYRFRRGWGGTLTPDVDAVTSNVPFVSLFLGHQDWEKLLAEMKLTNAGLALAGAVLLQLRRVK